MVIRADFLPYQNHPTLRLQQVRSLSKQFCSRATRSKTHVPGERIESQEAFWTLSARQPSPLETSKHLSEGRVGVCQQLLEVSVKPRSRLGSWFQRVLRTAVCIVSRSGGVRSAIAFTPWLNPHESVHIWVSSFGSRSSAESSADQVAPVTPFQLLGRLRAISTCGVLVFEHCGWGSSESYLCR